MTFVPFVPGQVLTAAELNAAFTAVTPPPPPPSPPPPPVSDVISAGVYDSTGVLVRTLWSNRPQTLSADSWDGLLDNKTVAPGGIYTIKGLTGDVTYTWEGVVGNTNYTSVSSSLDPAVAGVIQAQDTAFDMAINNGKIYIAAGFNEARVASLKATTANPHAFSYILYRGFTISGPPTLYVCTDGTKVFWGGLDGGSASNTFVYGSFISGGTEDTAITTATWTGGANYTMSNGVVVPTANHINNASGAITGLACQQTNNYGATGHGYFFVSRKGLNTIYVMRKDTGATVQTLNTFTGAAGLAVTGDDAFLWVIQGLTAVKYGINNDGSLAAATHTINPPFAAPLAIECSPSGATPDLVAIADGGTNQQVFFYNNSTYALVTTLGTAGGYATSPAVTNLKFMFQHPTDPAGRGVSSFIAFNPADFSVWIGDPGNMRNLHWAAAALGVNPVVAAPIDTLAWVPLQYATFLCQGDPTRLFAVFCEFSIDYSKPLAPRNGSWTLVNNWGFNAGATYFIISAVGCGRVTKFPNGRTYGWAFFLSDGQPRLLELTSTGLRNTGFVIPNGGFADVCPDGSIVVVSNGAHLTWTTYSLTNSGADPTYDSGTVTTTSPTLITSPYPDPKFSEHTANSDHYASTGGILSVFDGVDYAKDSTAIGWHFGGIDKTTQKWVFKTSPSGPIAYGYPAYRPQEDFPKNGFWPIAPNINDSGGPCMVQDRHFVYQNYAEGWEGVGSGQEANKLTHYYENGLLVGEFGVVGYFVTDPTFGPANSNTQAGMHGNAFSSCFIIVNGIGYIYQNDESYKCGVGRWRIDGLSTIAVVSLPVGSLAAPAAVSPYDMLAGLPFDTKDVPNNTAGWTRSPASNVTTGVTFNWWSVSTNVTNYITNKTAYDLSQSPDLTVSFASNASPSTADASVTKTLPTVDSQGWTLTALLQVSFLVLNDTSTISVEIADINGFLIFQLYFKNQSATATQGSPVNFLGPENSFTLINTVQFPQMLTVEYQPVLETPFTIGAGVLNVTYAGVTKQLVPVNALADVLQPSTFSIRFHNAGDGGNDNNHTSVSIKQLTLE